MEITTKQLLAELATCLLMEWKASLCDSSDFHCWIFFLCLDKLSCTQKCFQQEGYCRTTATVGVMVLFSLYIPTVFLRQQVWRLGRVAWISDKQIILGGRRQEKEIAINIYFIELSCLLLVDSPQTVARVFWCHRCPCKIKKYGYPGTQLAMGRQ